MSSGKIVCVTGASGYIASWLVKLLLLRGYTVKASVRNPNDPKKTKHLLALEGAEERLQLFKADLLEEGSFDSIVEGCEVVFHTASLVNLHVTDPQLWYWYVLSKTLAEEYAWKFAKENGIGVVSINPAMVIGPLLQPTLNTSAAGVLSLIKDVANVRIQAFEIPSASGRYCLVERVARYSEIVKILHDLYPSLKFPEKCADDKPYVPTYQVSKQKMSSLGIEFISLEVSLKETVESLKEKESTFESLKGTNIDKS